MASSNSSSLSRGGRLSGGCTPHTSCRSRCQSPEGLNYASASWSIFKVILVMWTPISTLLAGMRARKWLENRMKTWDFPFYIHYYWLKYNDESLCIYFWQVICSKVIQKQSCHFNLVNLLVQYSVDCLICLRHVALILIFSWFCKFSHACPDSLIFCEAQSMTKNCVLPGSMSADILPFPKLTKNFTNSIVFCH